MQDLNTNGVPLKDIPDIYIAERYTMAQAMPLLEQGTKEQYSHDAIYGQYANLNAYIECPHDIVFNYAANIYSLEEWTFSVRNLKHEKKGLYKGVDVLAPNTNIYVQVNAHKDSGVVDYLCAWDQGQELWMRYYMRFIDAMPAIGKPGTILSWVNCKHPYYERGRPNLPKVIADGQARQDRPWVGDLWKYFKAAHQIETDNMKKILEYRFRNSNWGDS